MLTRNGAMQSRKSIDARFRAFAACLAITYVGCSSQRSAETEWPGMADANGFVHTLTQREMGELFSLFNDGKPVSQSSNEWQTTVDCLVSVEPGLAAATIDLKVTDDVVMVHYRSNRPNSIHGMTVLRREDGCNIHRKYVFSIE